MLNLSGARDKMAKAAGFSKRNGRMCRQMLEAGISPQQISGAIGVRQDVIETYEDVLTRDAQKKKVTRKPRAKAKANNVKSKPGKEAEIEPEPEVMVSDNSSPFLD